MLCADAVLDELRIKGEATQLSLKHIGGSEPPQRSQKIVLQLSPLLGETSQQISVTEAFSVPNINIRTPVISSRDRSTWKHLLGLPIPDCSSGQVELLLGANVLEAVIQREVRVGRPGQPVAIRTAFGWTLTGAVSDLVSGASKEVMLIERVDPEEQLMETVQHWWTTESFGTKFAVDGRRSKEDELAQKLLERNIRKYGNRYEASLLWRDSSVFMPNNQAMAVSRLKSLEKSLLREPDKARAYKEVIQQYIENGHARKVPPAELAMDYGKRWFLPHHAVTNPKKSKIRVVFDAAASFAGISLNDKLLKGPDLLQNLVGVLLRFRQEKIAMVADIEQMFHQIRITESDQPAMSFLWRNLNTYQDPDVYQMTVSIFGMKCSPAIANFVLRKTAEENCGATPQSRAAALAVKQNFYMDDFLRSEPDVQTAKDMQSEVTKLVALGGFHLTKWMSNDTEVLEHISRSERAHPDLESEEAYQHRALGCVWSPSTDSIGIYYQISVVSSTKRGMLQAMASVFDPLGIVSPFTLRAKMLIQKLWVLKYAWDEQLKDLELDECEIWLSQTRLLQDIVIPRCLQETGSHGVSRRELHVFCDASENAFAAVAYLLTITSDGLKRSSFVMSRSRLAPLKQLTIVRMELQAAVLAVRLANTVKQEMTITIDETALWSDSKVVLHYIRNESRRFHTFVANRVSEIQESSKLEEWRHIPGKANPADIGSRGASLLTLKDTNLWWRGPAFLETNRNDWPEQPAMEHALDAGDTEVKMSPMVLAVGIDKNKSQLVDSTRFSSWIKYRRVFAWILRFVENLKVKSKRLGQRVTSGPLSAEEIEKAEICIVREDQAADDHHLQHMSPFLDQQGIWRVGGRLTAAPIAVVSQHPIILSADSDIVRLIVNDIHERLMHSGLNHTLNKFRMKHWMPKASWER